MADWVKTTPKPFLTRLPTTNVQVTNEAKLDNARSESSLMVNPRNPLNMVGASKRFTTLTAAYQFTLRAYATHDGGQTWKDHELGQPNGTDFTSDPAVAYDDLGNAFVMGHIWNNGTQRVYKGLAVYKSTDGGDTWSTPNIIYTQYADKQTIFGDTTLGSPHHGNVYAAWDGGGGLMFARTKDHGGNWIGVKQGGVDQPVGSLVVPGGVIPTIAVAPNGKLFVFYYMNVLGSFDLHMITSTDGGDSFTSDSAAVARVVTGVTSVPPQVPGGHFRLESIPTSCASGSAVVVAWADYRNGRSQIFYRRSNDAGATWLGSASGELLTAAAPSPADQHDFMPQLAAAETGEIGCCFCEFGSKGGSAIPLIDVVTVVSIDSAAAFDKRLTVTDLPWDPAIDAPLTGGAGVNGPVTFIGDYFGFAAGHNDFHPFWTDTRTGVQELFTSRVFIEVPTGGPGYVTWLQILFGIINDGGGIGILGGHIVVIPPRGPELEMLSAMVIAELAKSIPGSEGKTLRSTALKAVAKIATQAAKSSGG
jgi:hypothetical protein